MTHAVVMMLGAQIRADGQLLNQLESCSTEERVVRMDNHSLLHVASFEGHQQLPQVVSLVTVIFWMVSTTMATKPHEKHQDFFHRTSGGSALGALW